MTAFVEVAHIDDLQSKDRVRVEWDGRRVTIFKIEEKFYAILDTCPHKKTAPLLRGTLDGVGIKCPNHGFRFDLETGQCAVSDDFNTTVFSVKVEDGKIFLAPRN
ncbi:MAG: Rieske (2Fe-2S) protein [Candidatus Nitrohelix vancouverensis]|uniref:Rieske (2Fe-2S) protein n=1 Tax=Candidatus Nitrohelix vancouverensis TaxID=2705534 RepID=A0A7T0G470_9BACT|nr:MAG: Rieske (2Fe-2S) protein [Candidatus Nitrohelix vancouverensis]